MRTQISTNVSERTREMVNELTDAYGYSQRVLIEVAIDRMYRDLSADRAKKYRLDIYTWPTLMGVDPQIRTSYYDSPQDAQRQVKAQPAFSYAALQINEGGNYYPCNWSGERIQEGDRWPLIYGTNRKHPAIVALESDWDNMIKLVISGVETGKGAIIVASRILEKRHPDVVGYSEKLAAAAMEMYASGH